MGKVNPVAVVTGVLAVIFCPVFQDGIIVANNDGPYGGIHSAVSAYPNCISSMWSDANYLGGEVLGTPPVSFSAALRLPGLFFLMLVIGTAFAIFYKQKHDRLYRVISSSILFSFCALVLACCIYPLVTGDNYFFYRYPWMFSLSPVLFNLLFLFGITEITRHTTS